MRALSDIAPARPSLGGSDERTPQVSRRHVFPAQVVATPDPTQLSTILGSCVSVCLWDRRRGWGGMCHHVLPDGPADDQKAARFANVAVPQLIDELLALGSEERDLVARLFGGARVLDAFTGSAALLGARNVEAALAHLAQRRIHVDEGDVGGRLGRKVRFSTWSGAVTVTELQR